MNRRQFIRTGLIFVPTWFITQGIGGSVSLSALDPEVYGWMGRVRANGGNYTSLSVVASDAALKMVKASGHRSRILRWNLYCGLDLLACMTPLVNYSGNPADTASGTAGGWVYSQATGLRGNGTDNCVITNFAAAAWPSDDDCCMGVYARTNVGGADAIMGVSQGSGATDYMLIAYGGTASYVAIHNTGNQISFADSFGLGHYMGSRISSTDFRFYKNGVSQVGPVSGGGGRTIYTVVLHAYNVSGTGGAFSARTLGGYELCQGLTGAQVLAHYGAVQRAQTILGRPV